METKLPQYKKLYELLRQQIKAGVFKEGDLLPSENELCKVHLLTRPTVRQALNSLVNDGFIKKHKGKGSIVNQVPNGIGILSIRSTTSAIGKSNLKTSIILKPEFRKWPENFMFLLSEMELNYGCIYMERLRLVNNMPLFFKMTYLPNINLPRFISFNLKDKSLFETLQKYYQIEIKGGEQKFKAITADETVSKHLNIEIGSPILHLERKHITNRGKFYFYSSLYCNTGNYSLYGTF